MLASIAEREQFRMKFKFDFEIMIEIQNSQERWMMLGVAMAIQENGTDSLDYFAMLRGWEEARST